MAKQKHPTSYRTISFTDQQKLEHTFSAGDASLDDVKLLDLDRSLMIGCNARNKKEIKVVK